ncbi:MAG: alkaline phosphatase family protein [Acidobacteriaceae bacterium]|nr:alkaline phosphatase family protein [Acidobacteriaceae bacterium]
MLKPSRNSCVSCALLGLLLPLFQVKAASTPAATPIKYVVVIFDENISFDHYFGTYPNALYPQGQPVSAQFPAGESPFSPLPATPVPNALSSTLLNRNPNGINPFRLDRSMASTCDNSNAYKVEQQAYNLGLVNMFTLTSATGAGCPPNLSMAYYDGNTVTALWNYAQYFAMSDNFFDTEFGTTVMGHLNLVSGQTHTNTVTTIQGKVANGSVIANVEAGPDDCVSAPANTPVTMSSKNVGDLLNAQGITWGWFYGDFPQSANNQPIANCTPASGVAYNSHYDPFQYYVSTSNQHHLPPSSAQAIGTSADQANHQYALADFWNAVQAGNMPSVVFLKASRPQTGHPSDSTPLEEQTFLVNTINQLQQTPFWNQMAIFITYDDSDGWYDHVMPPIVNQSNDSANDAVTGPGNCGTPEAGAYLDRCGYGTRLPLLVISPYAKQNYIDHGLADTTSVLRFIEDNWNLGRLGDQSFDALAGSLNGLFDFANPPRPGRSLLLDASAGTVVKAQ